MLLLPTAAKVCALPARANFQADNAEQIFTEFPAPLLLAGRGLSPITHRGYRPAGAFAPRAAVTCNGAGARQLHREIVPTE